MMTFDKNGPAWVAKSMSDLYGWQVISNTPWKKDVHRVEVVAAQLNGTMAHRIVYVGCRGH